MLHFGRGFVVSDDQILDGLALFDAVGDFGVPEEHVFAIHVTKHLVEITDFVEAVQRAFPEELLALERGKYDGPIEDVPDRQRVYQGFLLHRRRQVGADDVAVREVLPRLAAVVAVRLVHPKHVLLQSVDLRRRRVDPVVAEEHDLLVVLAIAGEHVRRLLEVEDPRQEFPHRESHDVDLVDRIDRLFE